MRHRKVNWVGHIPSHLVEPGFDILLLTSFLPPPWRPGKGQNGSWCLVTSPLCSPTNLTVTAKVTETLNLLYNFPFKFCHPEYDLVMPWVFLNFFFKSCAPTFQPPTHSPHDHTWNLDIQLPVMTSNFCSFLNLTLNVFLHFVRTPIPWTFHLGLYFSL